MFKKIIMNIKTVTLISFLIFNMFCLPLLSQEKSKKDPINIDDV